MTLGERKLWYDFLCKSDQRWLKQRPIGPYIADFYCAAAKLIVELDGDSHFTPEGRAYDAERITYLEGLDIQIIRFTNAEVMESFQGVATNIEQTTLKRVALFEKQEH